MTDAEALKLIPFVRHSYNTKNFTKDSYTAGQWFDTVENALKQKAERTGRWEMKEDPYGFFDTIPVCSACGCTPKYRVKSAYCPYCGARMEVE